MFESGVTSAGNSLLICRLLVIAKVTGCFVLDLLPSSDMKQVAATVTPDRSHEE